MTIECTKIKILPTVRQAYSCLWHYKLQHILISLVAVLPFCLAGFWGFLEPVFSVTTIAETMPDDFNQSFAILVMTTFIWAVPVIILWHRLYLLGPEHLFRKRAWPLITRSLKVISHSLVLLGMGMLATLTVIWGIFYLRIMSDAEDMTGTITEMSQREYTLYMVAILLVLVFLLTIGLRFSMAFSSLTIGKSLRFTASWRLTRKNTFRMLIAALFSGLPVTAPAIGALWLANHYFQIDLLAHTAPDPEMIYIFILIAAPILTLPLATLCSLTSTFYRHCGCADFRESQN